MPGFRKKVMEGSTYTTLLCIVRYSGVTSTAGGGGEANKQGLLSCEHDEF